MVTTIDHLLSEELPPTTPKQEAFLSYYYQFRQVERRYPSHREINRHFDVQSNSAHVFITPMLKKGYLVKNAPGKPPELTNRALEKLKATGKLDTQLDLFEAKPNQETESNSSHAETQP